MDSFANHGHVIDFLVLKTSPVSIPFFYMSVFFKAVALIMPKDNAIFILYSILREASRGIGTEPLPSGERGRSLCPGRNVRLTT